MKMASQLIKKGGQCLILFSVAFLVSACGNSNTPMDKQTEDGKYHYKNQDVGFKLELPSTFKKYQTQRKKGSGFTEIQILVPTGDKNKFQEVRGYARPVTVRVYDSPRDSYGDFREIARQDSRVYTIRFWQQQQVPADWQEKWSEGVKNNIRESFQLISG